MKSLVEKRQFLMNGIGVVLSETKLYIKNNNAKPESMTLGEIKTFADFLSSEYGEVITHREVISALVSITFEAEGK